MQKGIFPARNNHRIIITESGVEHMKAHPIADEILHEAFGMMTVARDGKKFWKGTVDMGRSVGLNGRVSATVVDLDQPTLFALRHNRKRPSRCAIAVPSLTPLITVVLRKGRNPNESFFVSAWTGDDAPAEPTNIHDPNLEFWCNNALIWTKDNFVEAPFTTTWRTVLKRTC
jgi:hypothetical protein